MQGLRFVSETAEELSDKVQFNSIAAAFLILVIGFSLAYIVILLLNKED